VPILFTDDMLKAVDILMQCHDAAAPADNKFVFTNPGTSGCLDIYKTLQKVAEDSGMKKPKLLTATRLRKYVATMAQLVDWTCNLMKLIGCLVTRDIAWISTKKDTDCTMLHAK